MRKSSTKVAQGTNIQNDGQQDEPFTEMNQNVLVGSKYVCETQTASLFIMKSK